MQSRIYDTRVKIANLYNLDINKIKFLSSREIDNVINLVRQKDPDSYKFLLTPPTVSNIESSPQKNITFKRITDNDNGDGDDDSSEEENKNYVNKKTTIKYNSSDYTEPEYVSDYMISLKQPCPKVKTIILSDISLPDTNPIIMINNNITFKYTFDTDMNNIICIPIPEKTYNIQEIIQYIQNAIKDLNPNPNPSQDNNAINIKYANGHIIINTHSMPYMLINDKNSILHLLGFTQDIYTNNLIYKSEKSLYNIFSKPDNKIYMYIDTISVSEPVYVFDPIFIPSTVKKVLPIPVHNIRELIIKFKKCLTGGRDPNQDSNQDLNQELDQLYDFNNKHHSMKITLI